MKKIVLIGASGFIGSAILKEALDRGHKVTAVVRHPEKITLVHKNMMKKEGDVSFSETVSEVSRGADIVISSYSYSRGNHQGLQGYT